MLKWYGEEIINGIIAGDESVSFYWFNPDDLMVVLAGFHLFRVCGMEGFNGVTICIDGGVVGVHTKVDKV